MVCFKNYNFFIFISIKYSIIIKESSSIGGHTDFYYPNLTYQIAQYQQDLPEMTKIKRIPMPTELIEQFNRNYI